MYLDDLENFLQQSQTNGIGLDIINDEITHFSRLIVLLYADDTVILANTEQELQNSLNLFNSYCEQWKLQVNLNKTKVVIFGARKTDSFKFTLGNIDIEITDRYKYLGIFFSQSRSFLNARKHIAEQAKKAMHLLFCRINNLHLPIDLQLKLFDQTVMPILTYGSEIFGFENLDLLEKIHTDFLKKITKCRRSTPSYILYAELGRFPIEIIIKSRIIGYWNRIILGKHTKISYILYQALKTPENVTSKWILNVKRILCDIGRHDLWLHQAEIGSYSAKYLVKQTLKVD